MVRYKRTPSKDSQGSDIFVYYKNGKRVKESTIPHEVMEKFEIVPEIEYDDEPERRRCIFCDAPQKRIRSLNMQMVDLCEWHYQHMTLGKIAQQVAKLYKEANPVKYKKHRHYKKTQLSEMVK